MGTKHSPLPWKSTAWERGGEQVHDECAIHDANGEWVGDTVIDHDSSTATSATPHANAAFIVNAVNSHDDLLAACKAILCAPSIGSNGPGSITLEVQTYRLNQLRAAIAKAEGQDGDA